MILFLLLIITPASAFQHCIVTNTPDHQNVKNLLKSANNQVTIIEAKEQEWRHSLKLDYYKIHLQTLAYNEIVLLTDAYDVILIDNHSNIIESFLKFNVNIVVSAENNRHPLNTPKYGDKNLIFPYLNSGGIIGYAGDILSTINRGYSTKYGDQYSWTQWYLNQINNITIVLDHNNEIFISMYNVKDVQDSPFKHLKTSGIPKIIHFNGDKSLYESYVLKYLSK